MSVYERLWASVCNCVKTTPSHKIVSKGLVAQWSLHILTRAWRSGELHYSRSTLPNKSSAALRFWPDWSGGFSPVVDSKEHISLVNILLSPLDGPVSSKMFKCWDRTSQPCPSGHYDVLSASQLSSQLYSLLWNPNFLSILFLWSFFLALVLFLLLFFLLFVLFAFFLCSLGNLWGYSLQFLSRRSAWT